MASGDRKDNNKVIQNYLDSLLDEAPAENTTGPIEAQGESTAKTLSNNPKSKNAPSADLDSDQLAQVRHEISQLKALSAKSAADEPVAVAKAASKKTPAKDEQRANSDTPAVQPKPSLVADDSTVESPKKIQAHQLDPLSRDLDFEEPEPDHFVDGVPDWAYPDFQVLFFNVGIIRLAVPLIKLRSVIPFKELTKPPEAPAWFLGMLHFRGRNIKIVDTAELVIPPDHEARESLEEPKHILLVGSGEWGITSSSLGEVYRFEADEVKWRRQGADRPWLMGTVRKHLCVLLDSDAFARMLKDFHLEEKTDEREEVAEQTET